MAGTGLQTLARPYARALWAAAESEALALRWREQLSLLVNVAVEPVVARLLSSVVRGQAAVVEQLLELMGDALDESLQRLVRALAHNRRLSLLIPVAQMYAELCANAERRQRAEIVTATALSKSRAKKLLSALEHRLKQSLSPRWRVDPKLLGGFVLRRGDNILDASLIGRVERLRRALV